MKKMLLLALSFGLLVSCKKDDENGIPPVKPNEIPQPEQKPQAPQQKPHEAIATLEVKDLKEADYVSYRDKKVKLHGEIAEVTKGKSYFKFGDGTLVQIFTHKFKELPKEVSDKLKVVGQELTVVGTFTDFKAKDGSIVKEIIYESEADLTFGKTPESKPEVKPQPQPQEPIATLEATTATVSDFQEGKEVRLHGKLFIEGRYAYFKFADNTLIQLYTPTEVYKTLPKEVKDKLKTADQEVTIKGKFHNHEYTDKDKVKHEVKQIVYQHKEDISF